MLHALINFFLHNGVGQNITASPIWAFIAYMSHRLTKSHMAKQLEEHHAKLVAVVNKSVQEQTEKAIKCVCGRDDCPGHD